MKRTLAWILLGLVFFHRPTLPMAPSVNNKRFTDIKFIEKWFKRNCQWTWGRRCTAAEKGQILMFLTTQ